MNRKMLILAAIMMAIPMLAFAQYKATIAELVGKVEVKAPGASAWTPARVGAEVLPGTVISTGIKSGAVLLMGNTRLNVKALTRLSLKELTEKQDTISTELFLTVGKVGADVKPVSGKLQTFTIGSPVATASVRGTAFEFDGVNLEVTRGEVAMGNALGFQVPVAGGETAAMDPETPAATIVSAVEMLEAEKVVTDMAAVLSKAPPVVAGPPASYVPPPAVQTGTVVLTIQLPKP